MSASLSKYRQAFDDSQLFLDALQINSFPIEPFSIFSRKQGEPILVLTLKQYNASSLALHPLAIKDAKCFYKPGRAYLIVYNSDMPENRIRFSLIHELGHIVLQHLNDERTEICRGENGYSRLYCIMEGQANTFAGNFLAPPILIREKLAGNKFNYQIISSFFGMSDTAVSEYRYKDYQEWLQMTPSLHEKSILDRCKNYMFPKLCAMCGNLFQGKSAKYCPVCGSNFYYDGFNPEEMESMIYSSIQQNGMGKAIICPRCGNEQMVSDGEYCEICGVPLYNRCAPTNQMTDGGYFYTEPPCEMGHILPGNARFCPYCGNETTYNQAGLLTPWTQESRAANKNNQGEVVPTIQYPMSTQSVG